MRVVDNETRATMTKRRNFVNYATMTLADGTVLNLTPADFRITGNTYTDDLVDGENFQVGTALGKTATIMLDNTDERFSQYDFYMAYFYLDVHLPDAHTVGTSVVDAVFRIGKFTVIEPVTTHTVITMSAVDEMYKFDKSFDSCNLDFSSPKSLYTILVKCCNDCGVAIGFTGFDNQNLTVSEKPEGVTYRQVVSYICQMAGVNAKISGTGALTLSWYDMSPLNIEGLDGGTFSYPGTTSYLDGDTADGGSFNPWNTGYEFDGGSFTDTLGFHQLTQIKDVNISTDDIQITGVKVTYDETVKSYGTDVYMVEINDNPFVAGHENTIASYLYNKLKVLNFRPFTCSNLQDPTIESGDCALLWDAKGNSYKTIITNVSFSVNSFMNISCTAKAPTKQGSTYVNAAAQAVVQARRNTEKQIDEYSQVVNHFNELANNSLGYYKTVRTESGATITYIHDQPQLANSRIIWKITGTGIFISEDGGQSYTAGYDASTATMLVNLVYAVGINCDWIHSGTLTLGGNNNVNGVLSILNGSGAEVGKWNNAGIEIKSGSIKLTKTGWNDTTHNGVFIGSNGIQLGIDNVFQVTNTGALTASSATITGKVTATSGRIGGNDNAWNIGTQSIYNGCTGINNTNSGTYVGIDGIRNQNGSNYVKINSGTLTANNVDIDGGSITIQRNVSGQMVTYFSVSSNGSMNARAGYIGNGSSGWTIADSSIYNGCTGIDDNNHTGTYVGTNGIRNQGTNGARVRISGGGIQANSGNIGGFAITSNSLGNTIGTDNAVGMISQDQLYAWSSGKSTRIKFGLIQVATGSQSDTGVRVYNSSNESGDYIHYGHSDVYRTSDGRSVEWGGSDERLKEGIEDLTLQEAKEIVSLARPRKFRFKSTANERGTRYGFIAQELRESLNTLKEESGIEYYNKEQEPHYHNIHYMDFIAPLCVIIRDMQAQIDELKNN